MVVAMRGRRKGEKEEERDQDGRYWEHCST